MSTTPPPDDTKPAPPAEVKPYTGPDRRVRPRFIEVDLDVLRESLKKEINGEQK